MAMPPLCRIWVHFWKFAGLQLGDGDHLLKHEAAGGALDLGQISESDIDAGFQQTR
jgi:hypothetical protein